MSDREYVIKALEGDKDAYGALIDAYKGMVFGVALNITGNYSDSEDIVQEAFLRAYEKLRTLSDPSKFAKWLYGLTRNLALQVLRQKRKITVHAAEYVSREQADSYSESPAEVYARKELSALLWSQVAELPPKTREAILLYYMEGFSIKRAAAFIGISEGAMKMRLKFGREKLRESIMEKIEGELRQRQPSRKTRDAILAALPAGAVPPTGIIESIPAKVSLSLMGLSAKKIIIITGVVLLGLISILTLRHYYPQPPSSQAPPLIMDQEDVGDVAELAEIKESQGQQINGTQIPEADLVRHSINGRVLEKGADFPIPGVIVVLKTKGRTIKDSITNQQGAFSLSDLADGRYELALQATDKSIKEKYYIPSDGGKVKVTIEGQDVDNLTLTLSRATYISGQVVDQNRKPIEGATLRLEFDEGTLPFPATQSDANGGFTFSNLYPGRGYSVNCEAPGFTKASVKLIPEINQPIEGLSIQLFKGRASISGHVVNKEHEPLKHVLVQAVSSSIGPMGAEEKCYVFTDSNGTFCFHDVAPGEVTIETALDRVLNRNVSVKLNAKRNDTIKDVKIVVGWDAHEGQVAGVVVDEANQAVSQGFLFAYDKDQKYPEIGIAIPNEVGEFKIANLEMGKPIDIFYCPSLAYRSEYTLASSGWENKHNARNILVPTDNVKVIARSPRLLHGCLEKEKCTIRGLVLDKETLLPIEQFAICITYLSGCPLERDQLISCVNPRGQFEIENVPYITTEDYKRMAPLPARPGTFVYVEAKGYQGKWEMVNLEEGMKEAFVRVLLGSGLSVQGCVVNMQNEPVEGARVRLNHDRDNYVFTDGNGEFILKNLRELKAPIATTLRVFHHDYATFKSKLFPFNKDVTDFQVQLTKAGTITGGVVDHEGKAVAGALINITGESHTSVRTGREGVYLVQHLQPGYYDVSLSSPIERLKAAWVVEGEETVVDFGVNDSTIYGTVFVGDKPLPSAEVVLMSGFSPSRSTHTNSNGKYTMSCIVPRHCYLWVNHDGKTLTVFPITIPENQKIQRDIVIRLGSISGCVVKGEDGVPVADVMVYMYHPDSVFRKTFPTVVKYGQAVRATKTSTEGHFEFDTLAAGEYVILALSEKLGQAFARASIESDKVSNVVLTLEPTGSLRLEAVDADTGEKLSVFEGRIRLRDTNGLITSKDLDNTTPVTVDAINAGVYSLTVCAYHPELYISEVVDDISVKAGEATPISLRMRRAIWFIAEVIDANNKTVTDFECFLYDSDNSPLPIDAGVGSRISGLSLIGDVRLVLTKNGKTIYDDYIQVTSLDGERTFQTRIVIK